MKQQTSDMQVRFVQWFILGMGITFTVGTIWATPAHAEEYVTAWSCTNINASSTECLATATTTSPAIATTTSPAIANGFTYGEVLQILFLILIFTLVFFKTIKEWVVGTKVENPQKSVTLKKYHDIK